MRDSQDRVFFESEGDKWFVRNHAALKAFTRETDFILRMIELYRLSPRRVLEVGAANGVRLATIAERYGSEVVAIEPSAEAIADGKSKFPRVNFIQATAASIPAEEPFDLVIVNGVFCWIDRKTLLQSVAEVDRLLTDGGFLLVGDFNPSAFVKVRYHHVPDRILYTYKQNYAALFLASGLYHMLGLLTWDHMSRDLTAEGGEDDRFGVWLLGKSLSDHYVEKELSTGRSS